MVTPTTTKPNNRKRRQYTRKQGGLVWQFNRLLASGNRSLAVSFACSEDISACDCIICEPQKKAKVLT
jgi:hypothetical protein